MLDGNHNAYGFPLVPGHEAAGIVEDVDADVTMVVPGDHVLVPQPSYPLFEFLATMENVGVRQYPLVYHGGWSIDLDALRPMITERTRAHDTVPRLHSSARDHGASCTEQD